MATLLKVLINLADIKSARGVALRVGIQALMAAASIGHESAADSGGAATIVSPRILEHPPAEIAPGGTVVLRGNSPARPEAPISPEATVADYPTPALLPPYGWDRRYDTSGWDRRYDNSGIDLRYDTTGR